MTDEQQATPSLQRNHQQEQEEQEEFELKYGAEHVIKLFVPVCCCMLVVVITINSVLYYGTDDGTYLVYAPFTAPTDNSGTLLLQSLGNGAIIMVVVIVMTFVLILLYKYRCYKVIWGWLILSSLMLLSIFSYGYMHEVLSAYNLCVDFITAAFLLWNWAIVGMIAIHWKAPLIVQQTYLVAISALMALLFIKFLPEWTAWVLLGFVIIWDLVAVLCPNGPLRMLVEMAQERNEPLFPALIYTSGIIYIYTMLLTEPANVDSVPNDNDYRPVTTADVNPRLEENDDSEGRRNARRQVQSNDQPVPEQPVSPRTSEHVTAARNLNGSDRQCQTHEEEEQHGVKLGLGDFIFYSVLVGKASSKGDWNTTIACYIAILVGLCFTLILLAVFKKALPALPISIAFGLIFYFSTNYIVSPYQDTLATRWIFI